MEKKKLGQMMEQLLHEMEEEDIGISLLTTFYQIEEDLEFFRPEDQDRILKILALLSDDGRRHKRLLERVVRQVGERYHEK